MIPAAKVANEPAAPDPSLVMNDDMPPGHKQYTVNTFARMDDAAELTEGVDVDVSQQFRTNTLTIDPPEHGSVITYSKRLRRRSGDASIMTNGGKLLGISLRARMAKDIIVLYDGFSNSTPGTGAALDITHFSIVNAFLMTDNDTDFGPAPQPYNAALHAQGIRDIVTQITDTAPRGTTVGFTDEMLRRWWKGRDRVYGNTIWHSGYILANATPDAKGALFNPDALLLVHEGESEPVEEVDNTARLVEIGLFQSWGEAERVDPWGYELFHDATAT
jgi:hypothetical protein